MKNLPSFKRGTTFSLACVYRPDGGLPASVEGIDIRSQLRTSGVPKLVADLEVIRGDQAAAPGAFTLVAHETAGWPVGLLVCDIMLSEGGVVRSSETFGVPVVAGVTT